jgi:hypothetical protein
LYVAKHLKSLLFFFYPLTLAEHSAQLLKILLRLGRLRE